jgi:hypothetical protein
MPDISTVLGLATGNPYALGGAILGGLFGGQSSTQTQTANKEPWGPAQDLLKSQIYNTGQLQNYYQQNPFSPMQQAAYKNAFAQNDSMRAAAPGVLQRLSSNQYFDRGQPLKMPQAFDFAPKANDSLGLSGNSQALSPLLDSLFSNPYTNGSIKPMAPTVAAIGPNTVMPEGGRGGDYASTSTPDYATAYSLAKMTGNPTLMGYVTDGILNSSNSAAREADAIPSITMGLAQGYDGPNSNRGANTSQAQQAVSNFVGLSPEQALAAVSAQAQTDSGDFGLAYGEGAAAPAGGRNVGGGVGGGGLGGAGVGGDPALNAKGGFITAKKLRGPNPPGPDDGYSGLDIGEYVIKKSAVNKYGQGLLGAINQGKLPAKALRGLL